MFQYMAHVKANPPGEEQAGRKLFGSNVVINPRPSFQLRLAKRLHDITYETNRRYCDGLMYELEKEKEN